jgi:hypothetical protein
MTLNGVDMYYSGTKAPPEWQIAIFLIVVFIPALVVMVVLHALQQRTTTESIGD